MTPIRKMSVRRLYQNGENSLLYPHHPCTYIYMQLLIIANTLYAHNCKYIISNGRFKNMYRCERLHWWHQKTVRGRGSMEEAKCVCVCVGGCVCVGVCGFGQKSAKNGWVLDTFSFWQERAWVKSNALDGRRGKCPHTPVAATERLTWNRTDFSRIPMAHYIQLWQSSHMCTFYTNHFLETGVPNLQKVGVKYVYPHPTRRQKL